ncbi:hypothetical protein C0J52_21322 [Blattella germanica]|nr:hypothetical protein C0J52_21322 [Blattella germanica]
MATNKISIVQQPLDSDEFISDLRSFRRMLSSCIGPGGGIKIIISAAGYSTFTSSSSRLLSAITVDNPVCIYINQIIKTQINSYYNDFGLYSGVFITFLLEKMLSHNIGLSTSSMIGVIEHLSSELKRILDLDCIKLKVDFSTVKQLLPLVRSVISSKPLCGLTKNAMLDLQINIVKGFLQTIGETVGKVFVECHEGSEMKSQIFSGILYQIKFEDTTILNNISRKQNLNVLLFNIMLTEDETMKISDYRSVKIEGPKYRNNFVEEALNLFDEAVKLDIDIVACQKVIHPSLCLHLQRKGILVLERLGTDLTMALETFSGAIPISSIKHCPTDKLCEFIGRIDCVKGLHYGDKQYVSLIKQDSTIATLLVHAPNEEAASELKVVIKQCLSTLNHLISNSEVIPGAGCFEMSVAVRLLKQVRSNTEHSVCTRTQLNTCVRWMQMALLSAAGFSHENFSLLTVDTMFGHLWKSSKETCCCGLISTNMIETSESGQWKEIVNSEELLFIEDSVLFTNLSSKSLTLTEQAIIDLYKSKQNAINISLETCINLFGIGMIVYKPSNH